jgi:hypothetical protein
LSLPGVSTVIVGCGTPNSTQLNDFDAAVKSGDVALAKGTLKTLMGKIRSKGLVKNQVHTMLSPEGVIQLDAFIA